MCGLHRSADCWTLSHRREPAETKEGFLTFSDRSPRGYGGGIDDYFDIRNAVIGRVAIDEREALSLRLFVEYFDRLDQPFSETADPVHVTGVLGPIHPRLNGVRPFRLRRQRWDRVASRE